MVAPWLVSESELLESGEQSAVSVAMVTIVSGGGEMRTEPMEEADLFWRQDSVLPIVSSAALVGSGQTTEAEKTESSESQTLEELPVSSPRSAPGSHFAYTHSQSWKKMYEQVIIYNALYLSKLFMP